MKYIEEDKSILRFDIKMQYRISVPALFLNARQQRSVPVCWYVLMFINIYICAFTPFNSHQERSRAYYK